MAERGCPTPFLKQLFVTAGVSLNIGQFGMISGYVVAIVPQLTRPGAYIPMDDSAASWFASIHALSLLVGYSIVAKTISDYGRRVGSIISSGLCLAGWISILLAGNLTCLLLGRILQGLSLGFCLTLGPIVIAECTSPKNRGIFLASTTMCLSIGSAVVHYLGSFLHWRDTALVCSVIGFIDLIICIYSPETPTWLAGKGRFDECKKIFRWLRGDGEDEELFALIQAVIDTNCNAKTKHDSVIPYIRSKCCYILATVKKKEVYKSITIGVHLLTICYWCGSAIFSSFPIELIDSAVGKHVNTPIIIMTLDINRLMNSVLALYVVRKFKRRTMLFSTVGLTIICSFVIAGYVYAKDHGMLPSDVPIISIILLHIQMFSISIGALSLPVIIGGEIYPRKHRSLASAFTRLSSCVHVFIVNKSFLDIVKVVKIYGCYCIFGSICLYALIVCYFLMPETKDRTLQDIEDELGGTVKVVKENTTEVLLEPNGV
ncbi:uncharacterized protein LOC128681742 [Plodia interpunctella]|uniref:uncharacterized protein LOC128681742 n=1 Tax=Plodia interpunctella TaxID=58824 RepID=UPI002368241D|nr:uncharacterized protein LOC128681742 [Plodia interpunctella]